MWINCWMGGHCVLVFDDVLSGGNLPAFRKNLLLPSYRRDGDTTFGNVGSSVPDYTASYRRVGRGVWAGLRRSGGGLSSWRQWTKGREFMEFLSSCWLPAGQGKGSMPAALLPQDVYAKKRVILPRSAFWAANVSQYSRLVILDDVTNKTSVTVRLTCLCCCQYCFHWYSWGRPA
jgi:hypothetical protein